MGRPPVVTDKPPVVPIRFVRCPTVDYLALVDVLRTTVDWDFSEVGHLSVSRDYTMELQRKGVVRALPLGALVDALEYSLMRQPNLQLSIDEFPQPVVFSGGESDKEREDSIESSIEGWNKGLSEWSAKINSRRILLLISIREIIYKQLTTSGSATQGLAEVFDSGGAIAAAIRQMTEIGLRPQNFQFKSAEGVMAGDLWTAINEMLPDSRVLLDYLFIDHNDAANRSDSDRVLRGLEDLIRRAFNFKDGHKPRLVYHGMFFYTPLQWALFELLARAGVEQVFIVHDDQKGPQFVIWRRFFSEAQGFQEVKNTTTASTAYDPRAQFLSDALSGHVGTPPHKLELAPFASITELARHIRQHDQVSDKRLARGRVFAAGTGDLNRQISRLSRVSGEHDDRMLFALPVGRFLMALQEIVRVKKSTGVSGIDFESLVHLVEGGYLNRAGETEDRSLAEVLIECKIFFSGCRTIDQWRLRLSSLGKYYEPNQHGIGDIGLVKRSLKRDNSVSDKEYLVGAVNGHLRRAPWLDLTRGEWQALNESVNRIFGEVETLSQDDAVDVEDYIEKLIQLVVNSNDGVRLLGEARWREVCEALASLPTVSNVRTEIIRIGEILPVMLGKSIDYGEQCVKDSPRNSLANALRGLEACGFVKREGLHITNLSDTAFPSKIQVFSWPFRRDEVVTAEGRVGDALRVRIRLVDELERSAGLGDIYLLWLALNGTEVDGDITLSWLSKSPTENLNPSPLLTLMLEVPKTRESVREFAGGFEIKEDRYSQSESDQQPALSVVSPLPPERDLLTYLFDTVPTTRDSKPALRAFGSVEICARRTALQWLTRTSSSYHGRWQLEILYGNLLGLSAKAIMGLIRLPRSGEPADLRERWNELLDALWAWMTPAEREKTAARSSIHQRAEVDPARGSASPEWLLTLQGTVWSRNDGPRVPRMSLAYRFAKNPKKNGVSERLLAKGGELLPKPHLDGLDDDGLDREPEHQMWYLCDRCPAADRCLERSYRPK
jgi:hypothetical protein